MRAVAVTGLFNMVLSLVAFHVHIRRLALWTVSAIAEEQT
jgi:hypothetical protein